MKEVFACKFVFPISKHLQADFVRYTVSYLEVAWMKVMFACRFVLPTYPSKHTEVFEREIHLEKF